MFTVIDDVSRYALTAWESALQKLPSGGGTFDVKSKRRPKSKPQGKKGRAGGSGLRGSERQRMPAHVTRLVLVHGDREVERLSMLVSSWQEVDEVLPVVFRKDSGPVMLYGDEDGEVMVVDYLYRGWFRSRVWSCTINTLEWTEALVPKRLGEALGQELVREAVRAYCERGERKPSLCWERLRPMMAERPDLLEGGRPDDDPRG